MLGLWTLGFNLADFRIMGFWIWVVRLIFALGLSDLKLGFVFGLCLTLVPCCELGNSRICLECGVRWAGSGVWILRGIWVLCFLLWAAREGLVPRFSGILVLGCLVFRLGRSVLSMRHMFVLWVIMEIWMCDFGVLCGLRL